MRRFVSLREYRPVRYACQSLLIWNAALPNTFHSLSWAIMFTRVFPDGSKKQPPRSSKNVLVPHCACEVATTGTPVELLTTPMPPVVMRPGFVLLEMATSPMSGRNDVLEKSRSFWSRGFCSLYD